MKCQRCGLPMFDGAAYAGPQCKCWAFHNPAPHAAPPQGGLYPSKPLTEEDVRRIVRDEMVRAGVVVAPVAD